MVVAVVDRLAAGWSVGGEPLESGGVRVVPVPGELPRDPGESVLLVLTVHSPLVILPLVLQQFSLVLGVHLVTLKRKSARPYQVKPPDALPAGADALGLGAPQFVDQVVDETLVVTDMECGGSQ